MKAVKVAESTMFALNFLKFGAPTLTGIILIICVVILSLIHISEPTRP
mgnify:CR=1 FL=1